MSRRWFAFECKLGAAVETDFDAREQFCAELRRIADAVEEGSTSMEQGNGYLADSMYWEIKDPQETNPTP